MCTARLPTVLVSVATTRCQYWWLGGVGPQVNKLEQVSIVGRRYVPCLVSSGSVCVWGVIQVPVHHNGFMRTPWTEWQTDTCENITFPQVRLRTVTRPFRVAIDLRGCSQRSDKTSYTARIYCVSYWYCLDQRVAHLTVASQWTILVIGPISWTKEKYKWKAVVSDCSSETVINRGYESC